MHIFIASVSYGLAIYASLWSLVLYAGTLSQGSSLALKDLQHSDLSLGYSVSVSSMYSPRLTSISKGYYLSEMCISTALTEAEESSVLSSSRLLIETLFKDLVLLNSSIVTDSTIVAILNFF